MQAGGVVGYVVAFAMLITNGEKLFPNIKPPLGPVMLLTIFCFSVLTCGLLVFYKPYLLFMDKKPKEAANLVLMTAKWLGVFVLLLVFLTYYFSR